MQSPIIYLFSILTLGSIVAEASLHLSTSIKFFEGPFFNFVDTKTNSIKIEFASVVLDIFSSFNNVTRHVNF